MYSRVRIAVLIACTFSHHDSMTTVIKHPNKKRSYKKYANLASIFLASLARSFAQFCTYHASLALKIKAFLARYKISCKVVARKKFKIILLQDLIKILQENFFAILSCKIIARFFILQEKLHF